MTTSSRRLFRIYELTSKREALAARAFRFALEHDDRASQPRIQREAAALARLDAKITAIIEGEK
jgi:hypothetical protein